MRSSPSTAAKSCRNRMCRQGGKYAVWVDFFHGGQENMLQTAALSEKCTKIPGSLTLPGIFSCTPGRSRTCDLQSRSLTLYPTELRALISLTILPQQGRIVKWKCGKIAGRGSKGKRKGIRKGAKQGKISYRKISATFSAHWGEIF